MNQNTAKNINLAANVTIAVCDSILLGMAAVDLIKRKRRGGKRRRRG